MCADRSHPPFKKCKSENPSTQVLPPKLVCSKLNWSFLSECKFLLKSPPIYELLITIKSTQKFRKRFFPLPEKFILLLTFSQKTLTYFWYLLVGTSSIGSDMVFLLPKKRRWRRLPLHYLKEPPFKMCGAGHFNPARWSSLKINNPRSFSNKNNSKSQISAFQSFSPFFQRNFSAPQFRKFISFSLKPKSWRFHVI